MRRSVKRRVLGVCGFLVAAGGAGSDTVRAQSVYAAARHDGTNSTSTSGYVWGDSEFCEFQHAGETTATIQGDIVAVASREEADPPQSGSDRSGFGVEIHEGQSFLLRAGEIDHAGSYNRVGSEAIGFPDVQALANTPGGLIGASYADGTTTLIIIDRDTGVGQELGPLSSGLQIVGLAHEPWTATLYGVSRPTSEVPIPSLYTIDQETPAASHVGNLAVESHLEALGSMEGVLIGGYESLYIVDPMTGNAEACALDPRASGESLIYGLATWYFPGPAVEHLSWSTVKARYADPLMQPSATTMRRQEVVP